MVTYDLYIVLLRCNYLSSLVNAPYKAVAQPLYIMTVIKDIILN